jgi:N-acetylmuramoyl-L-alanine amidase
VGIVALFYTLFAAAAAWLTGAVSVPSVSGSAIEILLDDPTEANDRQPLPPVLGSPNIARPLVVIDAGHGGRDPGATSPHGGMKEKDATLAIALAIRDELVESGRVRVALTRSTDAYLVLRDRFEIARRLDADLLISVHADAAPSNDQAHGASIYTLSEVASDREAALLADRENQADLIVGARLSDDAGVNRILIDLAQRESMNVSADFARLLHREASALFAFRPDYHRFASLVVLKAPDIPSILFEAGYLTNAKDVQHISSPEGRQEIAQGITRAIEAHFAPRIVASPRS